MTVKLKSNLYVIHAILFPNFVAGVHAWELPILNTESESA